MYDSDGGFHLPRMILVTTINKLYGGMGDVLIMK